MNQKMAENFIKYGYEDHNVKVFWRLTLNCYCFYTVPLCTRVVGIR